MVNNYFKVQMSKTKYGNRKVTMLGMTFDSIKERDRYLYLYSLEKAGHIKNLKRQVEFILIPDQRETTTDVYKKGKRKGQLKQGKLIEQSCKYYADFCYDQDGKYVVEDSKGVRTKEYIIKRKLMLYVHNIKISEV